MRGAGGASRAALSSGAEGGDRTAGTAPAGGLGAAAGAAAGTGPSAVAAPAVQAGKRVDAAFARLRAEGRAALIPYVTVGDPDLATTRAVVEAALAAGADLVELGLPFSDPIADGPVIQAASQRALAGGFRLEQALALVRELRAAGGAAASPPGGSQAGGVPLAGSQAGGTPLLFMTYYNPVLQHGLEAFARDAAAAGADGLLVPDLSLEESGPLAGACRAAGLHLIQFLAPTSTEERVRRVAEAASGFVYLVSLTGVTGARERLSERLGELVARARRHVRVPLCVGFGISTPEQAAAAAGVADGVIVGSAVVRLVAEGGGPEAAAARVGGFLRSLREAMDAACPAPARLWPT